MAFVFGFGNFFAPVSLSETGFGTGFVLSELRFPSRRTFGRQHRGYRPCGKQKLLCRFAGALKRDCRFIFLRGADAVIGWVEMIVRMGGELYHGEIGDVHEVFAVVVALIYRERRFLNRTYVIVLCAAYLGLKGTVAKVAHD